MAKQKKKKIAKSGDVLPTPPKLIHHFPIGCAVKVDGQWWVLTFRIGQGADSSSNLRPIPDPHDPDWIKASVRGERRFGGVWTVTEACWPARRTVSRDVIDGKESDPLKGGR